MRVCAESYCNLFGYIGEYPLGTCFLKQGKWRRSGLECGGWDWEEWREGKLQLGCNAWQKKKEKMFFGNWSRQVKKKKVPVNLSRLSIVTDVDGIIGHHLPATADVLHNYSCLWLPASVLLEQARWSVLEHWHPLVISNSDQYSLS